MKELDELITYIENYLIGEHKHIEIIDEAIKKYAELYHREQLRIGGVSKSFYCWEKETLNQKCKNVCDVCRGSKLESN